MQGRIRGRQPEKRATTPLQYALLGGRRGISRARRDWYPTARETIARLRRCAHSRIELMSALVLAIFLPVSMLNIVASTQVFSVQEPRVDIRRLGDPERARERIMAENFTSSEGLQELAEQPGITDIERLVYRHTPVILRYVTEFPARYNTPIGVYYDVTTSQSGDSIATTIRYYLWFIDEAGGMPIERRLSTFGHSFDRELIYRVTLLGDEVVAAYYQAPGHRHIIMDYTGETRPVFTVASANHNFREVTMRELEHPTAKLLLTPVPHQEFRHAPSHDPDFMALAVQEIWEKYQIDLRNYVFVEFEIPGEETAVTISIRTDERWYYLHEQVGGGVSRPGYNQVGVELGYPILPGDIREVRVVAFSDDELSFAPLRVTIYPRSGLAA